MKNNQSPLVRHLAIGILGCLCAVQPQSATAQNPRGSVAVDRSIANPGVRPNLSWEIEYPANVGAIVRPSINGLNPVTLVRNSSMRVRVLGASFRTKSNNGHGNNLDGVDSSNPANGNGGPNGAIDDSAGYDDEVRDSNFVYHALELVWSRNASPWSVIFHGNQKTVKPCGIVLTTPLKAGDTVNFGARAFRNGWLPLYSTSPPNPNVVILKAGDPVPAGVAAFRNKQLVNYLKPYLSPDGTTTRIGATELLILFELGQSDPSAFGFNVQDLGVLVTFQ